MTTRARARVALFLPSLEGGGAERVILNLAIGFSQRGFPTDLVLASADGPYLALVPPAIRVVDLKAPRVLRSLRPLAAYLRRERPSAMLAALDHANLVAMVASRMAGGTTRTAISIHCSFSKHRASGIRESAIPWLLGRLHHWADAVIAVSEGVADDVTRATGIPRDRVDVIYNPVIMPALLPAAAERPSHAWFDDPTHPVVLGVGRLTSQKNFALLIDAFALVKRDPCHHRARLVILGEGPDRPALEAQVRRYNLGDSVALPGFLENPYACMARAAVFALSSDFEGLPTVLIESLAVGTPVVATDCESGPREILRGGELGELVKVGDVPAMAAAIARALTNPLPAALLPAALLPFTLDTVMDQLQAAFHLDA
jgi:glycosyltransferase involved in cell wall biosynthesis